MVERDLRLNVIEQRKGNALNEAARDLDKMSRGIDATDDKTKRFNSDLEKVNAEISKSTQRIKELRTQVIRTGDEGLFGDLRKEESRLRTFRKLADDLAPEVERAGAQVGAVFTNSFAQQLGGAFSGGGNAGIPALIAGLGTLVAVAAAPLGAIVAGAVVGTVGTGGVIGGVLAASHNSQVKQAFEGLFADAKTEFFKAGDLFVGPTIEAIGILDDELKKLNLSEVLGPAAGDVKIIAQGLADLVQNTLPGLNALLSRSAPYAQEAAKGFAAVGTALSEFLDNTSRSHGSLEGLDLLFGTLAGTIKFLGVGLEFLSDAYHEFSVGAAIAAETIAKTTQIAFGGPTGFSQWVDKGADALRKFTGTGQYAAGATTGLGMVMDHVGKSAESTAQDFDKLVKEIEGFNKVVDDMIGNTLGVDEALVNAQKTTKETIQTLVDNAGAWKGNTDAAIADREAIYQAIEAYNRLRESEIKHGESAADADAEFEANVATLLKLAQQAGLTKDALNELAQKYIIQVELASSLPGIGAAIAKQFEGITNGGGLATGGPALPGYSYTVGENGPETLTMSRSGGGWVTPNAGGGATSITIAVPGGDDLGSAIVSWLAKHAQVYGGGNVQLAITGRLN